MELPERNILIQLGLTGREADAYLALLQFGEATAAQVAEHTRESRSNVYGSLQSLVMQGLASFVVRSGVRYYSPAAPERLLELLKERMSQVQTLLPSFHALCQPQAKRAQVEVYEGPEGIKTVWNDMLRRCKELWVIGMSRRSREILHEHYVTMGHKLRVKAGIRLKGLINDKPAEQMHARDIAQYGLLEIRVLPKESYSPTTVYIYGDKIVIFMWTKKEPIIAVSIKSKGIADSFKNYFKLLWKTSKPLAK